MWGPRRSVVLTVFGECFDNPVFFSGREAFVTRYLNRPHAIVSSSKHCANSFSKVGVQRPIEPVYYGIDLERFAAPQLRDRYRTEIGVNPNEILVVYMGRFTDEMGLGRVIDVAPKIFAKMPAARLLLAGAKGPLGPSAQALAERFPDKVRIMNDVPFAVQPSVYAASDMVLAPSHDQHACMGMSIKEAMAASRPVIGSLAGGIPEAIVDEETGFLVPLDATRHIDASQLLDRIERLVVDADLRTGMGEAARRRAEAMFSMERTIDRMGEIFVAAMPA
jgi:glycosyltransferase involved in cell wall biosynthesis